MQGSAGPVSLTSAPGKVLEQIIISGFTLPRGKSQGLRPSQCWFRKGRSCLSKAMAFEAWVTCQRAEGKAMDGVSLDLSQAFDSVSHSTVLDKLSAQGLGTVFAPATMAVWHQGAFLIHRGEDVLLQLLQLLCRDMQEVL